LGPAVEQVQLVPLDAIGWRTRRLGPAGAESGRGDAGPAVRDAGPAVRDAGPDAATPARPFATPVRPFATPAAYAPEPSAKIRATIATAIAGD
jgi:hypothetical protein